VASLDDAAVEQRLAALDDMLGRLEQIPGATSALGLEAVQALTEVYGEALSRVLARSAGDPRVLQGFDDDQLLRHLLVLHDLHPQPLDERIAHALDRVRPYLHSHGGDVVLVSVGDGVAHVAMTGSCDGCASSAATLESAVSDAILAVAPELTAVEALPATAPEHPAPVTVISVDSLLRRPTAVGGAG
jgi:Fe-S cluster biogenesis protein NfuA